MNTGLSRATPSARPDTLEVRSDPEFAISQPHDLLDDLPKSTRVEIAHILSADEKLLHVERPSWIRGSIVAQIVSFLVALMVFFGFFITIPYLLDVNLTDALFVLLAANLTLFIAGMVGTILLIVLVAVGIRNINVYIFLGAFPLALLGSIFSCLRSSSRFILFTDKRCVVKPGFGSPAVIVYTDIQSIDAQWNWLFCFKEIQVKRTVRIPPSARKRNGPSTANKTDYIDAIGNIDYYCDFLNRMKDEAKTGQTDQAQEDSE